jgi:hypothetical protein
MRVPTRTGRRLWLFVRIVWRQWDTAVPEQSNRISWSVAWTVAKIMHE